MTPRRRVPKCLRVPIGALSAIAVLALSGTAGAAACPPPVVTYGSGCTSYTSSPECINVGGQSLSISTRLMESDAEVAGPKQVIETYRTQVTGVAGGTVVFEDSVDVASSSTAVEELIADASSAVDDEGGTVTEPKIVESTRSLESSDSVAGAPAISESETVQLRDTVGPDAIDIGENECVAWFVPSQWQNLDALTITERVSTVTVTTTDTYLTVVRIQIGAGDQPATSTTTTTAPADVAPAAAPAAAVESNAAYTG